MTIEGLTDILDKTSLETAVQRRPTELAVLSLLEEICPLGSRRAIAMSEHDQIWLAYDVGLMAEKITGEQARILGELGLFVHEDALSMRV